MSLPRRLPEMVLGLIIVLYLAAGVLYAEAAVDMQGSDSRATGARA